MHISNRLKNSAIGSACQKIKNTFSDGKQNSSLTSSATNANKLSVISPKYSVRNNTKVNNHNSVGQNIRHFFNGIENFLKITPISIEEKESIQRHSLNSTFPDMPKRSFSFKGGEEIHAELIKEDIIPYTQSQIQQRQKKMNENRNKISNSEVPNRKRFAELHKKRADAKKEAEEMKAIAQEFPIFEAKKNIVEDYKKFRAAIGSPLEGDSLNKFSNYIMTNDILTIQEKLEIKYAKLPSQIHVAIRSGRIAPPPFYFADYNTMRSNNSERPKITID